MVTLALKKELPTFTCTVVGASAARVMICSVGADIEGAADDDDGLPHVQPSPQWQIPPPLQSHARAAGANQAQASNDNTVSVARSMPRTSLRLNSRMIP